MIPVTHLSQYKEICSKRDDLSFYANFKFKKSSFKKLKELKENCQRILWCLYLMIQKDIYIKKDNPIKREEDYHDLYIIIISLT